MSGDQPDPAEAGSTPDVDAIARAVTDVEGVADLHGGVLGEVATYLPGRRVPGIRLRSPGCEIHLVLEFGAGVSATTDLVRAAVGPLVEGPVDVTVEDVAPARSTGAR